MELAEQCCISIMRQVKIESFFPSQTYEPSSYISLVRIPKPVSVDGSSDEHSEDGKEGFTLTTDLGPLCSFIRFAPNCPSMLIRFPLPLQSLWNLPPSLLHHSTALTKDLQKNQIESFSDAPQPRPIQARTVYLTLQMDLRRGLRDEEKTYQRRSLWIP